MTRVRSVRWAALGMTAVTALAGCSSSSSGGGSKPSTGAASSGTGAQTSAAPAGSKGSISMWTFKQSEVAALKAAGAEWSKTSGYTVKVTAYTPDAAYATKVSSSAKTHNLPDIISVHSQGEEWKDAQAGIIRDITPQFDQTWRSGFLPGIISGTTLTADQIKNAGSDPTTSLSNLKAGNFYAVPYLAGTPGVVFTRKSTMQAAGLNPASLPKTWQQWIADIKATHTKNAATGGVVTGLQVPQTGDFWLYRPMAYAYLGKDAFYGREGKTQTPAWNSTQSLKTLQLYDQLTPLWTPGVLNLGIGQADQSFAQGKSAWDVGGTFTLSSLTQFGSKPSDISVFPVPAASGGAQSKISYQASPLVSGAVTTSSKHSAQALDFLKFLTNKTGAAIFAKTANDVAATSLDASAVSSPLLKQLLTLISTTKDNSVFAPNDFSADPGGGTNAIVSNAATLLNNLPAKQKSVQQVADTLASQYKQAWSSQK